MPVIFTEHSVHNRTHPTYNHTHLKNHTLQMDAILCMVDSFEMIQTEKPNISITTKMKIGRVK